MPDLESVSNIVQAVRGYGVGGHATAFYAVLRALRNFEERLSLDNEHEALQPYVLIIDELNRGNVAAIFGELITLLEDDKRLGAPEEIQVTLPYSKQAFGVPPNLYLIGTMNTADRSVEALDSALRRRFAFEEVPPDPDVIAEVLGDGAVLTVGEERISLPALLRTLNARIARLLDRDHCLGHSHFLKVGSAADLRSVLAKAVLPLLAEYFFGDEARLQLVVGEGFCRKAPNGDVPFATADPDGLTDSAHYEVSIPDGEADFAAALRQVKIGA